MVIIGVTGGFGTGKTTIMAGLAKRGAAIISADETVHELLANDAQVIEQIRKHFGEKVFSADGSVSRRALGEIVFADAAERTELETILHPRVRQEIALKLRDLASQRVIAVEIPLLVESGWGGFDLVVSVEAVDDVVLARARDAGWTESDVRARQASQLDDFARREIADIVLHNNEDDDHLENELDELWKRIAGLPERNSDAPWPGPREPF